MKFASPTEKFSADNKAPVGLPLASNGDIVNMIFSMLVCRTPVVPISFTPGISVPEVAPLN